MSKMSSARSQLSRTPVRLMVSTTILVILAALMTLVLLQLISAPGHLVVAPPTPTIGIPIPAIK